VSLAVASGSCREIDNVALNLAQRVASPGLDLVGSLVGLIGTAEVAAGIALGMVVARARRYPRAALIPLFIAVTVIVESVLKLAVAQVPPPPDHVRTVQVLPLISVPFAHSFPSGHVARAAFLLRITNGIPTWLVVAGIVLMALTRIYLGEHWLSDTVGGAVLGLGVANVVRRLA
jgi:undecaprenyl-diphosphatase